jgi:hypothetical protein
MTGTPTPQTSNNKGVGNIFGLLKFLKHDFFSTPHWGEERYKSFSRSINAGNLSAFFHLQHLLNLFMVRHTKQDIGKLHKPIFIMTQTTMSSNEIQAYDTLVSAVQMNLIATSMKGKTSGLQDSLLNARQSVHARKALINIRLSCSGGTKIVPTLTQDNWDETLRYMRELHSVGSFKMTLVENFLHRMTSEQNSSCMCCGVDLQTLFLLPCACQICTECMTPSTETCPSCNVPFDIDDFQRLQPGLDYKWKWNIIEAQEERQRQQVIAQSLHPETNSNSSNNNQRSNEESFNLENDLNRLNGMHQVQRIRRKNEPHVCVYPNIHSDGKCKICFEIHQCNFMQHIGGKVNANCKVCHALSEDCPPDESKAFYITNKILILWTQYQHRGIDTGTLKQKRPLKIIIFSQFQQVSNLVGDRLIRRFGTGCVAEYWGSTRQNELERFTNFKDCFCLLLNKDGSHGLNLAFVTHIFFLDEILGKFTMILQFTVLI